jgi:predicted mannosyl-3-phosphoglycerate phosphatase (HAD superfamily)
VRSTTVVFCAIDNLVSVTHKALTAFPEFLEGLSDAGIPLVVISGRGRLELDATIRKFGLAEPFIAEGGCGVYLPEDYFHLKPPRSLRFARFTCIPQATPQPAAKHMLAELAEETEIETVALRDLSPRELAQNTGLAQREAELLRQRDFDELFFFAGAAEADVKRFREATAQKKAQVRPRGGALWSLAVGANLGGCVRDLAQLYQRSLRATPLLIGIATADEAPELLPLCHRGLLLAAKDDVAEGGTKAKWKSLPLFGQDTWEVALEAIRTRQV